MDILNDALKKRAEELMLNKAPRNETIMDEVFNFNVYDLESTDTTKIGQFIVGIAQFLMYFGTQVNKTKVDLMQKKKIIDSYVERNNDVKGTVKEKRRKVIDSNPELIQIELAMELAEQEITLVENREKYLLELMNAFKRELTRRENELKMVRTERKY